jgi:hypothetical protein
MWLKLPAYLTNWSALEEMADHLESYASAECAQESETEQHQKVKLKIQDVCQEPA